MAQSIVLQAVSWGNQAAQESTVDGAVVLNSVIFPNMPGDLEEPLTSGSGSGAGCDVELATVTGEQSRGPRSEIDIIAQPCKERLLGLLLAMALIVPAVQ